MSTLAEAEVNHILERFDQTDPAIQRETVVELINQIAALQQFKAYAHERLDQLGVSPDPEPVRTKTTGCRIGSRLNAVAQAIGSVKVTRDDLRVDAKQNDLGFEARELARGYADRLSTALSILRK